MNRPLIVLVILMILFCLSAPVFGLSDYQRGVLDGLSKGWSMAQKYDTAWLRNMILLLAEMLLLLTRLWLNTTPGLRPSSARMSHWCCSHISNRLRLRLIPSLKHILPFIASIPVGISPRHCCQLPMPTEWSAEYLQRLITLWDRLCQISRRWLIKGLMEIKYQKFFLRRHKSLS